MNEMDLMKSLNDIDELLIEESRVMKRKQLKRGHWLRAVSAAAVLCLLLTMLFPNDQFVTAANAVDLMAGVSAQSVEVIDLAPGCAAVWDFSIRLTQAASDPGENTLVSPMSLMYALAMTANGAKGETLTELESVMGMPLEELNTWLYSFSQTTNGETVKLANSVWFSNRGYFSANPNFLQTNADYYNADIYAAPFDHTTLEDINSWVNDRTDGMISEFLNEIPENAMMYLINALAFDAEWEEQYREDLIKDGIFTTENGDVRQVKMLGSTENVYLSDGLARGFVKNYKGGKYGFLAMLPNEGVTVKEYLNSLTGEGFRAMLDAAETVDVYLAMPEFETEFFADLSLPMKDLGVHLAFDAEQADFSGLGSSAEGNPSIGGVVQKTYIRLDRHGTKAAAVSGAIIWGEAMPDRFEELVLDRPFVYMIVDLENGIPLFIGTMMDPA